MTQEHIIRPSEQYYIVHVSLSINKPPEQSVISAGDINLFCNHNVFLPRDVFN